MSDIQVQKAPKPELEAPVGMPKTARIYLEESDEIPPGGLFIGHNGKSYMIKPGVQVDVPLHLLEVLDHAVTSIPVVDQQTKQVIGHRERRRYNYRLV